MGLGRGTERGALLLRPLHLHSMSPPQTQDPPSEPPSPTITPCGKPPICVSARRDLVDSPASLASSLGSPLPRAKELVLVRSRGGRETHSYASWGPGNRCHQVRCLAGRRQPAGVLPVARLAFPSPSFAPQTALALPGTFPRSTCSVEPKYELKARAPSSGEIAINRKSLGNKHREQHNGRSRLRPLRGAAAPQGRSPPLPERQGRHYGNKFLSARCRM